MVIITPEFSTSETLPPFEPLPTDISSNPFFLHHGDNPGTVIVSQPLYGDNFITWRRSMMMALVAKNKFGFVDGSIPKPSHTDPSFSCLGTLQQYALVMAPQLCD
jgi:hypothetical protein